MPVARAQRRGRGVRLCEELVSPALSESPHIERLADAQHSARRGSQQLVLPATPHPSFPTSPRRAQTRSGTARARGGPCGQRGRRSPAESHGEAGCGSARLKRRGRANRIGIAATVAGATEERPGPAKARHPTVYRGEPTGVRLPPQVNEYCGRAAPAVESAGAALS